LKLDRGAVQKTYSYFKGGTARYRSLRHASPLFSMDRTTDVKWYISAALQTSDPMKCNDCSDKQSATLHLHISTHHLCQESCLTGPALASY
uniref:Uncharacterized protein n=1 Tax=Romanomermis culicivorax TaxID=13658 RepID=A0A915IRR5_ROMCU